MKNWIRKRTELEPGDILVFNDNSIAIAVSSLLFTAFSKGVWSRRPLYAPTSNAKIEDLHDKSNTLSIQQVYRPEYGVDVVQRQDVPTHVGWSMGGPVSIGGRNHLDLGISGTLIWDRSCIEPEIEINVKINGTTAKLHDISEESLKKLRDLSERQDRETPDDEEDFFSPEDYR